MDTRMIIKPTETVFSLKNIKSRKKILHITDLHACAVTEEELASIAPIRAENLLMRRREFTADREYPPEDILHAMLLYAEEINADLVLLTGDIIDFPSRTNLELLRNEIKISSVPTLFIAGNHDWSFYDDYHTENAERDFVPYMCELSCGDSCFACVEWDDLVICAIDDSRDDVSTVTQEKYFACAKKAREEEKALILASHVPFYCDTLHEDTGAKWGKDLAIGGEDIEENETTLNFYRMIAKEKELAPDLVISGHLHIPHLDVFPNGTPQLVTAAAYDGSCGVVVIK